MSKGLFSHAVFLRNAPTPATSGMLVSDVFGNLSQVFWLFAQLPQIWTNYRNKSVEGLSLPFLLNWLLGDVTNLLGCLLTNQLVFQRNLAIYFNFIDLVLIGQFALYSRTPRTAPTNHYAPLPESQLQPALSTDPPSTNKLGLDLSSTSSQAHPDHTSKDLSPRLLRLAPHSAFQSNQSSNSRNENSAIHLFPNRSSCTRSRFIRACRSFNSKPFLFLAVLTFIAFQITTHHSAFSLSGSGSPDLLRSRPLTNHQTSRYETNNRNQDLDVNPPSARRTGKVASKPYEDARIDGQAKKASVKQKIGRASAWLCAILYLTSRIPQIMKNHARKSVEGLSILLFVLAFLGNLTYVLSILTSPRIRPADPRRHALEFLDEAVPYLIGSAGTLCFDFTIFVQSALYRNRPATCPNAAGTLSPNPSSPSITCSNIVNPSPPLGSPSTLSHPPSGSKSNCGNCPACPLLSSHA